jgi:hypothetical protein
MSIRKLAVAAAAAVLSACAPDAWQSYKATGFNQFLDTVGAQCQPLWIGGQQLPQISSQYAGAWQSNFDIFLDNTSQLYYKRMTPADYRVAVQSIALTTTDSRTNRSIDCIIAKLPSDRPSKPSGGY